MSDITAGVGHDAWANETYPTHNYATTVSVGVDNSTGDRRHGFVRPALSAPALLGRTVNYAELTGRVRTTGGAQTLTVAPLTEGWTSESIDWGHRPAATTPTTTATTPSGVAEGDTVTWDVTDLMQAVADGAGWHGFRITTSSTTGMSFWSWNSGEVSWELTISLSEAPEQPSDLRPDGGAVASQKPILAWDSDGDGVIPQAQFRVLVYSSEEGVTPVHDSGWVTSPDPQYDLAASSYTATSTPFWTVQTKSADGAVSEVSDRASFTYAVKPTLIVDTPTGGVIGDPTPSVAAHLSSGTMTMWQARVTGNDRSDVRYDTGTRTGALAFTVPWRNAKRVRVLRDEKPSWLRLRAWDSVDRASAVGDPAYVEVWVQLTFDDDIVPAPTALTVTPSAQGDPRLVWQWSHVETAEAYLLQSGGVTLERVDGADLTPVGGLYTYTDSGLVDPLRPQTLKVRAVEGGKRSPAAVDLAGTHSHTVEGVWLIPLDGSDPIVLNGKAVTDVARVEKSADYEMQDGSTVSILYGRPGLVGSFDLSASGDDTFGILAAFDALTSDETTIPRVQLVWGSRSIRVRLISPYQIPDPEITPLNLLHQVKFGFVQED